MVIALFENSEMPPNRTSSNDHSLSTEIVRRLPAGKYTLFFMMSGNVLLPYASIIPFLDVDNLDEIESHGLSYATVQLQITPSSVLQTEINNFCSQNSDLAPWDPPSFVPRLVNLLYFILFYLLNLLPDHQMAIII